MEEEYRANGQEEQFVTEVDPVEFPNVPNGHPIHSVIPDSLEYVPAIQFPHDDEPVMDVDDPMEHCKQTDCPCNDEYNPAEQNIQSFNDVPPVRFRYVPMEHP